MRERSSRSVAAPAELLDQTARFQHADQTGRGGLVHAELAGDLGDAHLAVAGQQFQHGHRPVDRLHEGTRATSA
jgi:hypothetical protein